MVDDRSIGAWGTAVFSDDLASDVRGDYRELIEDGVADEEAEQRVLTQYAEVLPDADEGPTVWIALAVTQSKVGRLSDRVRDRAMSAIDNGEGLDRWREDPKLLAKRVAVLAKVRDQLTGPQPARKRLRPPTRHVTDLQSGDLLAYRANDGQYVLFRVARIDDHRLSVAPILRALDYSAPKPPPAWRMRFLRDRPEPPRSVQLQSPRPAWANVVFRASAHKGQDYSASGFEVIGRVPTRDGDQSLQARSYAEWTGLAKVIEYNLKTT